MSITRDRDLAEDALQNLFVKLATARPKMENPAAYLFQGARNEALRVAKSPPTVPLAALDVISNREPSPDSLDAERVAGALDRLPREQSEVVLLHALEGLTFKEVGEVLEISQDTAASRYRYALEKLRGLLKS
jgi:RNA polymerase sigma-70 factor (ECF subfamily)